jgi:hypothetical protein
MLQAEMKKHRQCLKAKLRTLVQAINKVLERPVLLHFDFITLLFTYDFKAKFMK